MPFDGELILASASPRRRELLAVITPDFRVEAADADETIPAGASPARAVEALARRKAAAVLASRAADCLGAVVIGADTVVVLDGDILGKPRDEAHAAAMLSRLSGRRHTVYTGVAVADRAGVESFVEQAEVQFAPMTEGLIAAYVATGEPLDKAGAYGIQGRGARLIRSIHGDFYTVMGLPVCHLAEFLEKKYGIAWNL